MAVSPLRMGWPLYIRLPYLTKENLLDFTRNPPHHQKKKKLTRSKVAVDSKSILAEMACFHFLILVSMLMLVPNQKFKP